MPAEETHSVYAVNRYSQHILTAFFFKLDVPQRDAQFFYKGLAQFANPFAQLFCVHIFLRSLMQ